MNILIGSNGGLTGVYLAKQYSKNKSYKIFGADGSSDSVGRFFVSKQFLLPNASDSTFIDSLIRVLNENKIDIYLPTHSKEIACVSRNEQIIKDRAKTKILVSPWNTFKALDNKLDANRNLKAIGIPVPKVINDNNNSFPMFMKRNVGSGSSGSALINNEKVYRAYMETSAEVAFYQYVKGAEYTVDCLFDEKGILIGFNQRERVKTIGGAVSITRNSSDFDILPWIEKIAKNWVFCGCVNFQYILESGIPYFIDINLRYPSGGLPLTVESGLNIPMLIVDILTGKKVGRISIAEDKKHLSMYRYFEEIFE